MLPMCSPAVRVRLKKLLIAYDLPIRADFSEAELLRFLKHDKKAVGSNEISVTFSDEIGSYRFVRETAEAIAARSKQILCGGTAQ